MSDARDATGVPSPPMSVPTRTPSALSVKGERSIAAGTLLITWETIAEVAMALLSMKAVSNLSTASMLLMFAEKMKKHTNVRSRM